jgi:hypothetical protein
MRRLAEVAAAVFTAFALAGCSHAGSGVQVEAFCPGVGADHSVVTVNLQAIYARHPRMPLNVQTCVNGRCYGGHIEVEQHRLPLIGGVSDFRIDATRSVKVHFTALSQGRTVFDGSTAVRLHRGYINGKGCPPTTWFAQVSAHGDRRLRQDQVTYDEMYGR